MRIHSNYLTMSDITQATKDLPGVDAYVHQHGSRTHANAFEVRLTGNGYPRNTGTHGADFYEIGATWDEWGTFLARLFNLDANALCGTVKYPIYKDGYDFHRKTMDRFESLDLPGDTHKRHTWEYLLAGGFWACKKCSAERTY